MLNIILDFRNQVIKEAKEQAKLRQSHQPIPASSKKYARLSGLFVFLTASLGTVIILGLSFYSGWYYVFIILFTGILSVMGFIQMLTGRQILNRGK